MLIYYGYQLRVGSWDVDQLLHDYFGCQRVISLPLPDRSIRIFVIHKVYSEACIHFDFQVSRRLAELKTTIDVGLLHRDNLLNTIGYQFEQWNILVSLYIFV